MFRSYGFIGLISILLSYITSFFGLLPYGPISVASNNLMLMLGLWLFFDAVDFKLNKSSLLHKISLRKSMVVYIIIIGVLTGLFLEFFGAFVSNLWWEPFYTYLGEKPFYQAVLIFFSTAIAISYLFILPVAYSIFRVLNHFLRKLDGKRRKNKYPYFRYLGITGFIFILIPMPSVLLLDLSGFIRGLLFIFPLLGLWFILEYVEYTQHKRSLLLDLIQLKRGKLISIVITSILIGLFVEGLNLLIPGWSYKNFPLPSIQILGIPVIIIIGWVPLIIIILSFYRVFVRENEDLF